MRFLLTVIPITAALIIAACSPSEGPAPTSHPAAGTSTAATATATPAPGKTAPANPALGSPEWLAWVDKTLAISDDGHGPNPGTEAWDQAVNTKLGEEAPQAKLGSAEWQQAVDALLRTRVATH
ncbi:hypothetical protein BJI69_07500 [Luteibacter rhizovicinus DSM 16549]|uniref:Uncharacterized protein n=1 Tax=Luteibacter rhizovicinus DSM 16549 TaxID=1440763 RepID=A0A0G9HG81_9GAMM|nr:hypothetical protein [Luteibacter rhizovicinus]APG03770.1 hypothetical protein BJI69_07500 [Luteibacter rhizovicinus DSM 16549]KLD66652.1 hypothetical protein Y883_12410 [Luteibacter rhizovicinus DSM 16549]